MGSLLNPPVESQRNRLFIARKTLRDLAKAAEATLLPTPDNSWKRIVFVIAMRAAIPSIR
jgi:hypothetical protein